MYLKFKDVNPDNLNLSQKQKAELKNMNQYQKDYILAEAYQKTVKEITENELEAINYYTKLEKAETEEEAKQLIDKSVEIEAEQGLLEANEILREKKRKLLFWYIEEIKNLNGLPAETYQELKDNLFLKPSITEKILKMALNHKGVK